MSMRKPLIALMISCLATGMLLGPASAQDTPAATTSKPSSTPSTTAGQTAAKKPGTTAAKPATPYTLKTQKEKESYALGMSFGSGLRTHDVTKRLDAAALIRGLRDGMASSKTLLTEAEMNSAVQQLQSEVAHAAADEHVKASASFLAGNKAKQGVVALPDGLQYKILSAGNGPKPTASDTVTVNYRGTLLDGTEFDSSYKRGQPASFQVGGVIRGWTEALQLMPVGSKWQLYIPAELAYGNNPPPGSGISPGEMLIFEVELLSIGEEKKQ